MTEDNWHIDTGGVFRCCVESVRAHGQPGTVDAEVLPCEHCSDVMVWREAKRVWESPHIQRWKEQRDAAERRRAAGD